MRSLLGGCVLATLVLTAAAAQDTPSFERRPKARVFITDSKSWEVSGQVGGTSDGFGGQSRGGARPQTAEVIKTFGERCPQVTINRRQEKADYVVLLDHEGGKSSLSRDNKVVVFNGDGDSIMARSTRLLGNAVQEACTAITKDWPARPVRINNAETATPDAPKAVADQGTIMATSVPTSADIEIDGSFVGSTPSAINLAVGEHVIKIKKAGYDDWQRKLRVTSGQVNITAELQKSR